MSSPRVSVGLIVYNGENYLRAAVDSLLAQTYGDFELVLSDNGSDDATADICRDYASRDSRVRYERSEVNRGAAWNHNRVLELARGELFKLAAHDDVCHPAFLERCVSALDAEPGAVLAFTRMRVLRRIQRGWTITDYPHSIDLSSPLADQRFKSVIRAEVPSYPLFGVVRTACARRIEPFGDNDSADRVWLARLALLGPAVEVPEHLFDYRYHADQVSRHYLEGNLAQFYAWWNPARSGSRVWPAWRFLRELIVSPLRAPLATGQRLRCLAHAAGWAWWRREWLLEEAMRLLGIGGAAATQSHLGGRSM